MVFPTELVDDVVFEFFLLRIQDIVIYFGTENRCLLSPQTKEKTQIQHETAIIKKKHFFDNNQLTVAKNPQQIFFFLLIAGSKRNMQKCSKNGKFRLSLFRQ